MSPASPHHGVSTPYPPVAFDPELMAAMVAAGVTRMGVGIGAEEIPAQREMLEAQTPTLEQVRRDERFDVAQALAPGEDGHEVPLLLAVPRAGIRSRAALYVTHGGGLIAGSARSGLNGPLAIAADLGMALVSVEYRLAPEHPHPAPHTDAWTGLRWCAAHAERIGFDPCRIVLYGASAGGNLAAGLALRARDDGGPAPLGQMLISPMLDDRSDSVSARQMRGLGVWDLDTNRMAWGEVLAGVTGPTPVSAAPARARELSGLAPAYLEVGSAETFRDETVSYASRIWETGGVAELHVWPGAFHAFEMVAPDASLTRRAAAQRLRWIERRVNVSTP